MSGYRIRHLPFLTTTGGRVVGVIGSEGQEILFPTFSADGQSLLNPDGTVLSSSSGLIVTNEIASPKENYSALRAKLAAVRAGTGPGLKVATIGSSLVSGYNSLSTANRDGQRVHAQANQMAIALNSVRYPAQSDSIFANNNVAAGTGSASGSFPAYDPRMQPTGSASIGTQGTVGGFMFQLNGASQAWTFLPYGQVDTFDVYYMADTATGSVVLSRTGDTSSADTPTANAGGNALKKMTFTGALGNSAGLTITQGSNTAFVFIIGIDAYNSAVPSIRCWHNGYCNGTSATISSTSYPCASLSALIALAPDLVYLCSDGCNDGRTGGGAGGNVSVAQFTINNQKIIDACTAAGIAVVMTTGFPYQVSQATYALQKQYADANRSLAALNGLRLNDCFQKDVSWELQNSLGFQSDNLHRTAAGYKPWGISAAALLLDLA